MCYSVQTLSGRTPLHQKSSDFFFGAANIRIFPFSAKLFLPCLRDVFAPYFEEMISFNPHSRIGSDSPENQWQYLRCSFNPHSRVGSDGKQQSSTTTTGCFNPHSRVGSDALISSPVPQTFCFNPHSRVGSDEDAYLLVCSLSVSIHTPA